jgi:hypothetical protein
MNTALKRMNMAILATVAVQIITLIGLALLDTVGREQRFEIWLVIQVAWPILLTLDGVFSWSMFPASHRFAAAINLLFGCMFGFGFIGATVVLIRETSWFSFGRFALMSAITVTYFLNAFLLLRIASSPSSQA